MLDEIVQQNASNFAVFFWNKKTQIVFLIFHFEQLWICNSGCPALVQGICIWQLKIQRCSNWKTKKTIWFFLFQKYGKFWSIPLDNFITHKPLISEEWYQGACGVKGNFFQKKNDALFSPFLGYCEVHQPSGLMNTSYILYTGMIIYNLAKS